MTHHHPPSSTTILIVDDHSMVRKGLRMSLKTFRDLAVIGEAENGQQAIRLCRERQPDVVLMDVKMPDMNGIVATRRILDKQPEVRILALSSFDRDDYVREMLDAGAKGYLLKNISAQALHAAIRRAMVNGQTICEEARQALSHPVRSTNRIHELTPRQREVLELVYEGYTDQAIANLLGLSYYTVNHHMVNILRKLEVASRSQAVAQLQVAMLS